jgi:DNA-binding response OmpR family regulator
MAMSQEQESQVGSDLGTVKTILIVEDDAHIGEFLERALSEEMPYTPLVVSDAFEALKVTHEVKPDLFVLDYHLPGMDGIELYDQLHAVKAFQDTPAIILSARLPKRELEKRSLVGLHKPLELSELLKAIQEVLEREVGQSH